MYMYMYRHTNVQVLYMYMIRKQIRGHAFTLWSWNHNSLIQMALHVCMHMQEHMMRWSVLLWIVLRNQYRVITTFTCL